MDIDKEYLELLQKRIGLLERQVKFLLGQSSVPFVDYIDSEFPEVVALKRQGKIMDAIKAYRSVTGADMATAKSYVESL